VGTRVAGQARSNPENLNRRTLWLRDLIRRFDRRPKGDDRTRGICNRLLWMQQVYGLTASDRVLQKTPFSFDVSVWEFFWPLLNGASLVVARPADIRTAGIWSS